MCCRARQQPNVRKRSFQSPTAFVPYSPGVLKPLQSRLRLCSLSHDCFLPGGAFKGPDATPGYMSWALILGWVLSAGALTAASCARRGLVRESRDFRQKLAFQAALTNMADMEHGISKVGLFIKTLFKLKNLRQMPFLLDMGFLLVFLMVLLPSYTTGSLPSARTIDGY